MNHWVENKEFSTGSLRLSILFYIYKIFGRKALKLIILPIVFISYLFMKNARQASKQYFSVLYKHTQNPQYKPTFKNSFKHIYSFAEALIDKVACWVNDIKYDSLNYKNPQAVEKFFQNIHSNKGIFILCSHLGNIEILRAISANQRHDIRVNAFTELDQTKGFNDFLNKINQSAHLNLYSTKDITMQTAFAMKDKLDAGEVVVMAADRLSILNPKDNITTNFLGHEASFPTGAFRFMRSMECDFCFLSICAAPHNQYDVFLEFFDATKAKDYHQVINTYVNWLQTITLQYPYQWYNFYQFWNKGEIK